MLATRSLSGRGKELEVVKNSGTKPFAFSPFFLLTYGTQHLENLKRVPERSVHMGFSEGISMPRPKTTYAHRVLFGERSCLAIQFAMKQFRRRNLYVCR